MAIDLNDLSAFVSVARAGGFRDAAKLRDHDGLVDGVFLQ